MFGLPSTGSTGLSRANVEACIQLECKAGSEYLPRKIICAIARARLMTVATCLNGQREKNYDLRARSHVWASAVLAVQEAEV